MYILAIVGSPRADGNTNFLVDEVLGEAAKLGAKTEKIIISQHKISACLAHSNCRTLSACLQKDDAAWMLDKLCQADGVILATPVYYYDLTAWMKIFIDRNYFLGRHGKKARAKAIGTIVVAGASGIEETVAALDRYIGSSTFNYIDKSKRFVVTGCVNSPEDARNDAPLTKAARDLGKQMVASLK